MRLPLLILLIVAALGGGIVPAHVLNVDAGVALPAALPAQDQCALALDRVLAEPDWADRLINPVLNSDAEIAVRVGMYRPLYDCIATGGLPAAQAYEDLYDLTGYFLWIAGSQVVPPDVPLEGRGYRTHFSDIQDPAVMALRDEIGIPPPPGMLYVWLYPSVEAMPPLLAHLFQTDQVRAVTLYTRYIIVIDDAAERGGSDDGFTAYLRGLRSRTVSHELVHAYINSTITAAYGWERTASQPKWYSEGLAIHFSGSGEPSSFIATAEDGSRVPVISYSPDDYVHYRDTFLYLEEQYGRERFVEALHDSVISGDPQMVYQGLGIRDEASLMARVETDLRASRVQRSLIRLGVVLLALPVGFALMWFLVRVLLAVYRPVPQYAGIDGAAVPPSANVVPPAARLAPRPRAPIFTREGRPDVRMLERRLRPSGRTETPEMEQARADAARQLGQLHTSLAIAPLIEALHDRSVAVRSAAAWALGVLEATVPVTGTAHPTRSRWLTSAERGNILAELFHLVRNDSNLAVRRAAAASLFQTGGEPVMRPLVSIARSSNDSFQHWFAGWAAERGHYQTLIDLYPWAGESTRRRIGDLLRQHMTPPIVARLMRARDMGDRGLRHLADDVLGPPQG